MTYPTSRTVLCLPVLLGGLLVSAACDSKKESTDQPEKAVAAAAPKTEADTAKADAGSLTPEGEPAQDEPDATANPEADSAVADDTAGPVPDEETAEAGDAEDEDAGKADADDKSDDEPESGDKAKSDDKPKSEPKPDPTPTKTADPDDTKAAGVDGKALYLKKCKNCHGVTGDADTKIGKKHDIESWKEPGWKSKWTLAKVVDIVEKGKDGTKMKAFKGKLTPEEIQAVSKYARSLGK